MIDVIGSPTAPDLCRVLRLALPRMGAATGVDATMAGPVAPTQRRLVVTELSGTLTSTMDGLVVVPGVGIGGQALQLGRPAVVNAYLHSAAVSHHFDPKVRLEQIQGAFAVPVRVEREIRAVFYGLTRTIEPIGDRALTTAASVAAAVGRELSIEAEVARRLRAIEQDRRQRRPTGVPDVREIHEELLSIARVTTDPGLHERIMVLCDRLVPAGQTCTGAPPLSRCEREVLGEVALGRTDDEVAVLLSIMPTTVKTYLKNVMRKLGTRNRVETINTGRSLGLARTGACPTVRPLSRVTVPPGGWQSLRRCAAAPPWPQPVTSYWLGLESTAWWVWA
jgi:DNA-binding CsgD family transcriptional regulator